MKAPGFVPTSTATLWRASAAKVSVEKVAERAATLSWASVASVYTVHYAPLGSQFSSFRKVAHPRVALNGLRPGVAYDARVVGGDLDASVQFTTPRAEAETVVASGVSATDPQSDAPLTELSRLEIRVGKIIECERHPDADTLYVEKVDVGEEEPRTIVSGLVKFVPLDRMIGRNVVVLCNLKPRTMRGVTSQGMLLCASNEDHTVVDPLAAPEGAPLGELVTFEGHRAAPIDPGNRATKAFDRIADNLRTNDDGMAMYEGVPFATSAGPCVSPEKLVGSIS